MQQKVAAATISNPAPAAKEAPQPQPSAAAGNNSSSKARDGSPGRKSGRSSPSTGNIDIDSLMAIAPGTSFPTTLPPTSVRARLAHAAAGAARRNSIENNGAGSTTTTTTTTTSGPSGVDVWGQLDQARADQLAREQHKAKEAETSGKAMYNKELAAQMEEKRRNRAAEAEKEEAYKAGIRKAAEMHERELKEAEERRAGESVGLCFSHTRVQETAQHIALSTNHATRLPRHLYCLLAVAAEREAEKFQAFNAAVQKLKSIHAQKEMKEELAYVAKLQAEERAAEKAAHDKRVAALAELRSFLKQNDE